MLGVIKWLIGMTYWNVLESTQQINAIPYRLYLQYCYKLVQSFWVHCLFTGQFNTEDYGAFTDVT